MHFHSTTLNSNMETAIYGETTSENTGRVIQMLYWHKVGGNWHQVIDCLSGEVTG